LSHDDFIKLLNSIKLLNNEQLKIAKQLLKKMENTKIMGLSEEELDFIQSVILSS